MAFAHPPPYDGTPQLPSEHDGPLSKLDELPVEALNDEKSFLLFLDWQSGQTTSSKFADDLCSTSNFLPQSLHLYSKIGITFSLFLLVITCKRSATRNLLWILDCTRFRSFVRNDKRDLFYLCFNCSNVFQRSVNFIAGYNAPNAFGSSGEN